MSVRIFSDGFVCKIDDGNTRSPPRRLRPALTPHLLVNTRRIRAFIDGWDQRCHPFVWTKTTDQIPGKSRPQEGFTRPGRNRTRTVSLWRM
jgi:hypothetical protein